MGNEGRQALEKITKQLVGGSYKPAALSPVAIRRKYRANASAGKVASGFARNTGTGSARAGDIERTANTAERLAGVGQDSEIDINLKRMYQGSGKSKPVKAPVESPEFMEYKFQPTSKLDKPNRALNMDEVNRLYATRKRNNG